MTQVVYSFYVEQEAGIPAEDLNPEISFVKILPFGENISEDELLQINNSLVNLGDGIYTYNLNWDSLIESYPSIKAAFIKIDTSLSEINQKYITMRIERQDILPELVDDIQIAANTIAIQAELLQITVNKILAIEEGHWAISGTNMLFWDKSTTSENRTESNAIAIFELKDQAGDPSSTNVYSRIAR